MTEGKDDTGRDDTLEVVGFELPGGDDEEAVCNVPLPDPAGLEFLSRGLEL